MSKEIDAAEFFDENKFETQDGKPLPDWVRLVAWHRQHAAMLAIPAMDRLCEVLKERSGQPYKLRALLWSLWNGKPASLVEIVGLDWAIRQDLLCVLAGWGWEDSKPKFFYNAIEQAVRKAGQWDWFCEERKNIEPLKEWVKSLERQE